MVSQKYLAELNDKCRKINYTINNIEDCVKRESMLKFTCPHNHIFKMSAHTFKDTESPCTVCKTNKTNSKYVEKVESYEGYKYIDRDGQVVSIMCPNNHKFMMSCKAIKKGDI